MDIREYLFLWLKQWENIDSCYYKNDIKVRHNLWKRTTFLFLIVERVTGH